MAAVIIADAQINIALLFLAPKVILLGDDFFVNIK